MSELTEKVIAKIRLDGIEPEAGWKFMAKRSLLWIAIILTAGLGALSLSMTAFSLLAIDRSPFTLTPDRLISFALFHSLPFLWIGLAGAFFALAVFEFRNTRHGYRYRIALVAAISLIVIVGIASILSAWGADERAERVIRKQFPAYSKMAERRDIFWSRPEDGFLSGTIEEVRTEGISLIDREGKRWEIPMSDGTVVRMPVRLEQGERVKVIGKKKTGDTFEAEDIRPWDGFNRRKGAGKNGLGPEVQPRNIPEPR